MARAGRLLHASAALFLTGDRDCGLTPSDLKIVFFVDLDSSIKKQTTHPALA